MIEGRLFQSIQHEAGSEAGIEEDVQGAVEVVVRDRLADDLLLAGGIEEAVFDAISMFGGARASAFEEFCTEVSSDDVDPKLGHAAGEDPVAASDLDHRFAGLQVEQAFTRRTNEDALEVVA